MNENKYRQTVNKVHKTSDLTIFKQLKGNRPPNPKHIARLANSIKENGILQNPIIVNENLEVIDGQHRLMASKKAFSSIYYIIVKGYSLREVQVLNVNQKNWTKRDFMEGYADMGILPYVMLREFTQKNKAFTFRDCISMCSNLSSASFSGSTPRTKVNGELVAMKEVFVEGSWVGRDWGKAQESANKIMMLKPYYAGFKRSTFVATMLGLFNNKNFDFGEFVLKLKHKKLEDCVSVVQYKLLIEEIYNHRRRDKVSLRY